MSDRSIILNLKRIEAARNFIESNDGLEAILEKMESIETLLHRYESLEILMSHLHELEKQLFFLKEFLTIDEMAQYLSISRRQVYYLTSSKEIPYFKPLGKRIFIKKKDVNEWITTHRVMSQSEIENLAERKLMELSMKQSCKTGNKGKK